MEERDLAAVVVSHNAAALLGGTLAALEAELAAWPRARRLVVDSASSDGSAAVARERGWELLELDAAGATTPAAAREAGRRECASRFLLFVDGDVVVEPGFVAGALGQLESEPGLAGVGGELRFDEGSGAPELSPARPRSVELLAALALYRSADLEIAGGFVPWLESEEDADLGLRLRTAGKRLLLMRPGGIHRSGPRAGWAEALRRFRSGLYFGQGRVLRLRWGSPLFGPTMWRQRLYLAVLLFWAGAVALAVAAPSALWGMATVLAVAALLMALRKRGLAAGLAALATWHVMAWGLLVGWLGAPRAMEYRRRGGEGS